MRIHLQHQLQTAVTPSPRVAAVAAMLGLGLDHARTLQLIPPITLDLRPHQIIFITGSSGGGKTTLLRLIRQAVEQHNATHPHSPTPVWGFDALEPPPERPLVDAIDNLPLDQTLKLLSRAGINDAAVMLRKPSELSDGQRYRFQLARLMGKMGGSERQPTDGVRGLRVIVADEFGAMLDRVTARVIARNIRRWVDCVPVTFLAATTHDDLLEDLSPDVLIEKRLGGGIEVVVRAATADSARGEGDNTRADARH